MKSQKITVILIVSLLPFGFQSALFADELQIIGGLASGEMHTDLEDRFARDAFINETGTTLSNTGAIHGDWEGSSKRDINLGLRYLMELDDVNAFAGFRFKEQVHNFSYTSFSNETFLASSGALSISQYEIENFRRLHQDVEVGVQYAMTDDFGFSVVAGQRLLQLSGNTGETGIGFSGNTGSTISNASGLRAMVADVSQVKGDARGTYGGVGLEFHLMDKLKLIGELLYSGNMNGRFTQFGRPSQLGSVQVSSTPTTLMLIQIYENNSDYRVRFHERKIGLEYELSKSLGVQFGLEQEIVSTRYPSYMKSFALDVTYLRATSSTLSYSLNTSTSDLLSDAIFYNEEVKTKSSYVYLQFIYGIEL